MEKSVSPDLRFSGIDRKQAPFPGLRINRMLCARELARGLIARGWSCDTMSAQTRGAVPRSAQPLVRLRYSPVRVSISILSPVLQKSGTWTSNPVLSLAGFKTLPDVSPRTAGSV
jgi:hypothetical protein